MVRENPPETICGNPRMYVHTVHRGAFALERKRADDNSAVCNILFCSIVLVVALRCELCFHVAGAGSSRVRPCGCVYYNVFILCGAEEWPPCAMVE